MASKNRECKNVGIWIRVSHEDSVEKESPEHHEHRARAYAEFKGWNVVKVYRLDAVSGKSVKDRPETHEMLQDIKDGVIEALIFSKLARLARNTRELLDFADYFQEHSADLISLQESIDTSSPAGRLFYTMIAALAQWEREEISARVAASVPIRAQLGKPTGGAAPFGYAWTNGKLEIDPEEAPICKLMFELFVKHKRRRTVARKLNEAGHRTRRGNHFSDTTVERLLTNPVSKGKRRANYTSSTGDGKHWVLKPEDEWVYSEVDAIVTEDLWNQVNSIIEKQREDNAHLRKRPGRKPQHLFAGLTYCHCGTKMYPRSNYPKYVCQNCRNKIPIDDIDRIFVEQLKSFLLSPDDITNFLSHAEENIEEKERLLEVLSKEKRSVESEMDKVYRLYVDDQIARAGFGARYKPLEERNQQLDDEIPRLQGEIDSLKIHFLSNDEVFSSAHNVYQQWPNFSFEEKRNIVENLVDHITVEKDRVILDLTFSPSPSPDLPKYDKTATQRHGFMDAIN